MRVPKSAHTDRPWRIHAIAPDFRVEDVWALPTPGGPDDLPLLVEWFAKDDGPNPFSGPTRVLFAVRRYLGKLFGWDTADSGVGSRVPLCVPGCRRICARARTGRIWGRCRSPRST